MRQAKGSVDLPASMFSPHKHWRGVTKEHSQSQAGDQTDLLCGQTSDFEGDWRKENQASARSVWRKRDSIMQRRNSRPSRRFVVPQQRETSMTFTKMTLVALVASTTLIAAPAFAQSAGTSLTGTSNGMTGTPGQPSASNPTGGAVPDNAMSSGAATSGRSATPANGAMSSGSNGASSGANQK